MACDSSENRHSVSNITVVRLCQTKQCLRRVLRRPGGCRHSKGLVLLRDMSLHLLRLSVLWLSDADAWPLPLVSSYAVRLAIVPVLVAMFSLPYLSFRPSAPLASVGIGVAVFLIWIGPDLLFGYRHFWLFEKLSDGISQDLHRVPICRPIWSFPGGVADSGHQHPRANCRRTVLAGLADALADRPEFSDGPLSEPMYRPAFWIVALLFASEHGSYWEVGLAAGIVYNLWMIRTKSLADCILAHFVTNAILAAYVIIAGQWQYWL